MPHITLPSQPGIAGLLAYRPETGRPLSELAEVLLRGPSTLTRGERELIAARVSALNDCTFCTMSHAAFAAEQLPGGIDLVHAACASPDTSELGGKLKALLAIAGAVQQSGRAVTASQVTAARDAGATDAEIHDTVLIAAAFCMFNRYVDGLDAVTPTDPAAYASDAKVMVERGYLRP